MKAKSAGKGRLDLRSSSSPANESKIDILFQAKPCVVCTKNTLGWGMVTDIHVSGPQRFGHVCSRICNEKFYSEMRARMVWKKVEWVKGFIPSARK